MTLGKLRSITCHPVVGAILAISAIQYFLTQWFVSLHWRPAYSFNRNTISDLGNTACGLFNSRYVCSPDHAWMNASFIILGITMLLGALILYYAFHKNKGTAAGFSAFALGGLGAIVVGIYPENTVPIFHGVGALLPFLIGNMGIVLLGYALRLPKSLRIYTLLSGAVPLLALVCYASNHWLGLGEGGIERIVAYPQTIWWIVLGLYVLKNSGAAGQANAIGSPKKR